MHKQRIVIVLDCDQTMWDHPDATLLQQPFNLISNNVITDSQNEKVRLSYGLMDFLMWAKEQGFILAIASWNEPRNVLRLFELFKIRELLDIIIVEPHPNKDKMFEKIVSMLQINSEAKIIFIDDNPYMHEIVRKRFPKVISIIYGQDARDFYEVKKIVRNIIRNSESP